jgi:hypothetical protein
MVNWRRGDYVLVRDGREILVTDDPILARRSYNEEASGSWQLDLFWVDAVGRLYDYSNRGGWSLVKDVLVKNA